MSAKKRPRVPGTSAVTRMVANRSGKCPSCHATVQIVARLGDVGIATIAHERSCLAIAEGNFAELKHRDELDWLPSR